LLEQLTAPQKQEHLLDPRAIHQVERRLRGLGQPPRSVAEMAEWLRHLGDLTPAELEGPMAGFLAQLQAEGRARLLTLPGRAEPYWISTEEEERYARAFGLVEGDSVGAQEAGAAIFARFLSTHALVSLEDVLGRYPFERQWATRQLQEWTRSGRAVVVQGSAGEPMQWSAPDNLEQVQRGSLALLRREVITCPAPQFADFLLRWQGVHPEERHGGSEGLAETLARLQALPLPAELWEQTVLPARVPGYQPRWLDEWIGHGAGVWACQGAGESGPGLLAFFSREMLPQLALPPLAEAPALDEAASTTLDCLRRRGASFVVDLACDTNLSPDVVRTALWTLLRRTLVTNDRFDVIRRGEQSSGGVGNSSVALPARGRVPSLRELRGRVNSRPEGRWSLLSWGQPPTEALAVVQANLLLQRYGVVARELALLDPWLLPWRVLYEVLSRLELAGEVRRGYFVEGLSGAQFALPEAATLLQELHVPASVAAPMILLHSQDPANLYGSGAPFDIALLDGGTRPLLRRGGNWLVVKAGRPVLLAEQQGRRLTALASSSREEIVAAVQCLPGILDHNRSSSVRHKLTVDEWNGKPVTGTEGRELLEAAGFVRDYQGMTLYAAWR
jgi:ATP-dependent Lhr-like helicase